MRIHVPLGERAYAVVVGSDDLAGFTVFVNECTQKRRAVVVGDEHTRRHADTIRGALDASGWQTHRMEVGSGEESKSLDTAARLYDALAELQTDRQTLLVPVGGGVLGDVVGFVAATYARGLPLFMVPTTLLAMVDSSVGGKTAINLRRGKNLVGAFHQPVGVWIDTGFLATLPEREYRAGLAEVVKYGVVQDAELFAELEEVVEALLAREPKTLRRVIARCVEIKAEIIAQDERDATGQRAVLNYGHTFAHAFENVAGYGTWLHGEAVAVGMVCASRLAERLGRIDPAITQRQRRLLAALGLPVVPLAWNIDRLLEAMRGDKKTEAGRLRFVLPRRLGAVEIVRDVAESLVREVLERESHPGTA
jgi:3-dehydroquinate synthase